jgi:hypothetical protein
MPSLILAIIKTVLLLDSLENCIPCLIDLMNRIAHKENTVFITF